MNVSERIKSALGRDYPHLSENPSKKFSALGLDSLDQVEVLMILEEEFEMVIPDEDADNLGCIDDYVKYIESRLQ